MRRTALVQEVRRMRFGEACKGCQEGRYSQNDFGSARLGRNDLHAHNRKIRAFSIRIFKSRCESLYLNLISLLHHLPQIILGLLDQPTLRTAAKGF